jgi:hypothetical protein
MLKKLKAYPVNDLFSLSHNYGVIVHIIHTHICIFNAAQFCDSYGIHLRDRDRMRFMIHVFHHEQ